MTTTLRAGQDELTAQVLGYAERWRAIRRSTEPADRATAEAAVAEMYRSAGREVPPMTWADSPGAAARLHFGLLEPVRSRFGGRHEINDEWFKRQLGISLSGPGPVSAGWIRATSMDLGEALAPWFPGATVERAADTRVRLDLIAAAIGFRDRMSWNVTDEVELGLTRCRRGPRTRETLRSWRGGQFDIVAPTLAFGIGELGLPVRDTDGEREIGRSWLDTRLAMARSAGPWWAHPHGVVISERPLRMGEDAEGRFHAADGPALVYPDGTTSWFWHGVRVGRTVVEAPESLTVADVLNERNVEARRIAVERMGAERFLREGGAALAHEDETGRLWRRDMPSRGWPQAEPLVMVEVRNATQEPDGTYRTYFLRVPPRTRTAREGVAWTFGLGAWEYRPAVET
ncbi:MAG: DUF6745 domain-containing protein [Chloroflexota bacterium]